MRVQVQKWGNSLALRIPKPVAEEARIKQGTVVVLSLAKGKLVASPVPEGRYTLKKLLAGVSAENLHAEVDFGPAVGREVW